MHHYYYNETLDLQAMKAQAYRNSIDIYDPRPSVIHMHKYGVPCAGIDHLQYDVKEVLDGDQD